MNWLRKECEPYREMISAMLDGEISEQDKARLKTHMAKCDDCSALCVAMAAAGGAAKRTWQDEVPPALHAQIMARVQGASGTGGRMMGKLRRYARPALISAACIAVIAVGLLAVRPGFGFGGGAASGSDLSYSSAVTEEAAAGASAAVAQAREPASEAAPGNAVMSAPAAGSAEMPVPAPEAREEAETGAQKAASDAVFSAAEAPETQDFAAPGEAKTEAPSAAAASENAAQADAVPGALAAQSGTGADTDDAGALSRNDAAAEPGSANAEAAQISEDAGMPEETDTEGAGRVLMSLELEVFSEAGEDGGFQGTILSDSSGLLAAGATVTVRLSGIPEDGPAAEDLVAGDRVRVWYDGLSVIPEGFLVEAGSLERMQ